MSRPFSAGLGLFGFLAAFTFALIVAGLVALFVSFIGPSERHGIRFLITLTLLPGAAAFLLLLFQFGYHLHLKRQRHAAQLEYMRLEEWVAYAVDEGPLPPLDQMSASTLARLRETTTGSYSEGLVDLYERHGFLESDLDSLASRWPARRWRALSRLGQVRAPRAVADLQTLLASGPASMAVEVLRTLARTLDGEGMPLEAAREEFLAACDARKFTAGELESALVLTGRHCSGLIRYLLSVGRHPVAALNVSGHRNVLEAVPLLRPYLRSEDPEVRAAAFRTVAKLELAPADCAGLIIAGLAASQAFVRGQAAKALITVPLEEAERPLVAALGDPDWWVRRNAAASLAAFGPPGRAILARVTFSHDDRFARESARRAVE